MRARIIGVLGLVAAALAVIAATASGGAAATNSITVWLQVDAQAANWEPIVKAANAAFQREHPGVAVNVQYQTWGNHLQKFDATLAGGNAPDVIEMGNTEMTKYMAAGAFQDLTSDRGSFANSSTWLDGLAAQGRSSGKTVRRAVLRRLEGRHVPDRPLQEGGHQGADEPRASTRPLRGSSAGSRATAGSRRSTSPAPTGTSR